MIIWFIGVHLVKLITFDYQYHELLAHMDEVTALGAWLEEELVSCHIWIRHQKIVYSHLAASSEDGYKRRAAYAINHRAIEYFSDSEIINFGGSAGIDTQSLDGLARFKAGFSNDSAHSLLCGTILNNSAYEELCKSSSINPATKYFPAYRTPIGETI